MPTVAELVERVATLQRNFKELVAAASQLYQEKGPDGVTDQYQILHLMIDETMDAWGELEAATGFKSKRARWDPRSLEAREDLTNNCMVVDVYAYELEYELIRD